ncbi:odorant receptor 125-3 [Danio rerio]|uniref:Odorant receptor n=1 Tax=Danio rerio TaxID=7955 RepID=Q2PRA4_DANRE|nr:odorant receptor 125-3 [Danio rerio]ABC43363.1 odorant receptor [Danio rerio]|eukprot:NP_001122044.1 odorant receptor, family E, subfamily 125, member 3 [Danio rerio]
MGNITYFDSYTLMELQSSKSYRHIYFACFFLLFCLICLLNSCLCVVIVMERALHQPMFIFLCNLCINGIYGATGFYPKLLHDLQLDSYVIPSYMCALQSFVIYSSIKCEYSILAAMAYDRHVAICQPLDYHTKMNPVTCVILLFFCWTVPFITTLISLLLSNKLVICKNHIDKLYCDNWSMVKLSCESTDTNNIYGLISISFHFGIFIVIIFSYVKLVTACKSSLECRKKFWQTCMPHVVSLVNFSVAVLFDTMYSRYGSSDFPDDLRNFLALEIIIVPPLINPVIYGLNLKEIRNRVLKLCTNILKKS